MYTFVSPNLHLFDLKACNNIFEQDIIQVLRRSCKIIHLDLSHFILNSMLLGMNFEVPNMNALTLSFSLVDEKSLYAISMRCCKFLQFIITCYFGFTEKGLQHVFKNYTQLREINLKNCYNLRTNIAPSMLLSSPSLRKITPPPHIHFSESKRKLILHQRCVIC